MTHTGGATVPSITRLKKIFKNDYTVPHSTTFVLCYTVFFLSCLCANCVELGKLLETVLTPENETRLCSSLYGILRPAIPATEGSHSHTMTR